jgi:hypothetical protein
VLNSNLKLAQREPHGIKHEYDNVTGEEYLYHTNTGWMDWWPSPQSQHPNATPFVAKTDLSAETILWQTFLTDELMGTKTRLTDVIPARCLLRSNNHYRAPSSTIFNSDRRVRVSLDFVSSKSSDGGHAASVPSAEEEEGGIESGMPKRFHKEC